MVGISLFPSSKINSVNTSKPKRRSSDPTRRYGSALIAVDHLTKRQSCAQGFASSIYPTVCLSVLNSRSRWQGLCVTITTDRLGSRCLEPMTRSVKDSFAKIRGGSHARPRNLRCFGCTGRGEHIGQGYGFSDPKSRGYHSMPPPVWGGSPLPVTLRDGSNAGDPRQHHFLTAVGPRAGFVSDWDGLGPARFPAAGLAQMRKGPAGPFPIPVTDRC